jgi:hypothetical protein
MFNPISRRSIAFSALLLAAATVGWSQDAAQAAPLLPDCNDPVNCLQFEDFSVYSLALLNTISGTDDFDQPSSPGFLKNNAITIGTGAGGTFNNNDFIDEPYDTPNSVPGGSTFVNFESISLTDPDPTFTGDNTVNTDVGGATIAGGNMWDATTEALRSFFLPGEQFTFYFNLNEENKGGLDDGQDMFGWLQVTLTDLDGILGDQVFTLSGAAGFSGGDLGGSAAQTPGVDDILPTASDLWAHVHGEICVDPANPGNPLVGFGSCAEQINPPGTAVTVNQNLGANQAAFALFNQQLSDLILDPLSGYELVSIDLRMSHIDNGFEQLFILPTQVGVVEVAEPSAHWVFVLGLLGLASCLRLRRSS